MNFRKFDVFLLAMCWVLTLALCSNSLAHAVEDKPILLIEPSFHHRSISTLIPGAKRTVITPAWIDDHDATDFHFLEPNWQTTQPSFINHFIQQGRERLSERLALLRPRLLRDEHQVIQVAMIESNDTLTASTILAPEFGQQFVMIFGPEMLIAIPSANRIYIFSKLASAINLIAPIIRDEYKLANDPVSLEVFELDFRLGEGHLHAVGSLDSL